MLNNPNAKITNKNEKLHAASNNFCRSAYQKGYPMAKCRLCPSKNDGRL